jgi:23S rRNA (adenine2503-C2)-methyltransferase
MDTFFDFDSDSLARFLMERGMPSFSAPQIMDWVYRKGVIEPERMTNLSTRDRTMLASEIRFLVGAEIEHQAASDGTRKLLIQWDRSRSGASSPADRTATRTTECVMIPTESRRTACVSSQVGCPVGCTFCASGLGGLEGNLTSGQIVEQVFRLRGLSGVDRISHVVFMGMGEPLANFAAVTDAVRTLNAPWGMGIGARSITISTVGLPAAIRKLVTFEIPVTLALSLHAPNDELRRRLIPWASYTTIAELLDACDEYFQKSGREITLEYILLQGVNDRVEHARELAEVARRLRASVNLIRYNEVKGLPFNRPRTEDVRAFQQALRQRRVNVHIRASRGRDIAAACGQLRHEHRAALTTSARPQHVE